MSPGVPFQIEGVVEPFSAEGAKVAFGIGVTLHVPIEEPLQGEGFCAHPALEFRRVRCYSQRWQLSDFFGFRTCHRILDAVPTIDDLDRRIFRNSQLSNKTRNIMF